MLGCEANSLVRSVMAHSEPQKAPEGKKKASKQEQGDFLTETSLSGSLAVSSTNSYVAGDEGFEPPITGPEPGALPLGQSPIGLTYVIIPL